MTRAYIITVSFDDVPESDLPISMDPADLLQLKIERLAELLDCSEEEAERVLFDRL